MDTAGPSDRRHLTTLGRRRRQGETSIFPIVEEDPQIDEEEEDEGEDDLEELTAPVPDGPTDISLLRSFNTHVAPTFGMVMVSF